MRGNDKSMRIEEIEVINLRFDYPGGAGFLYGGGTATGRVTSIIRVHASNGLIGIGAAYSHPDLVRAIIVDHLKPLMLGREAVDVQGLWTFMYRQTRWYGRKGAALSALGAIDTALWDLAGKATGQRVVDLLGGERNDVPAYASGLLWKNDPAELAEEAGRHVENGFRRVKMRMGRSEKYDIEAVRTVRQAVGPDIDVIVDASMRYTVDIAERIGKVLQDERIFWYEEPFEPEEIDRYVELQKRVSIPLAAGENEFGYPGFRELLRAGAVDIVQPDACRAGGISEVARIGRYAHEFGAKVATHTWSDAVALMANAHTVAALPNGLTVEVDQTGNALIDDLLEEPLTIRDGLLILPNGPGLGIELNMATVNRWRVPDGEPIANGNYSDMVFGAQHLAPVWPYVELP